MRRFVLGLLSTFLAGPAVGLTVSDTVQLTDGNGTILMDLNGSPATGSILEADEATNGIAILTFLMSGTISSSPVTAALTEPDTGRISDNVIIAQDPNNQLVVSIGSDAELLGGVCGATPCMPETGQLQDLTSLLFPNGGAPFSVKVQSDTEVPEPSTAVLLVAGLGCISAVRHRRLRCTA